MKKIIVSIVISILANSAFASYPRTIVYCNLGTLEVKIMKNEDQQHSPITYAQVLTRNDILINMREVEIFKAMGPLLNEYAVIGKDFRIDLLAKDNNVFVGDVYGLFDNGEILSTGVIVCPFVELL